MTDRWTDHLADLLSGRNVQGPQEPGADGAELVVTDHGGHEVFRAPLARHWRVDTDDPTVMWIRPIVGGYAPSDPTVEADYLFHLNLARRRALQFVSASLHGDDVVLQLGDGQTAWIKSAIGDARIHLWLWDEFCRTELTEEAVAELARLEADSWHGPHA